ncbi:MAG TPA: hypothetical protein VF808_05980 [Ktedonobacterales bacterium]
MNSAAVLGAMLLMIVGWALLAPLAVAALRRWVYSFKRPRLGSAISFGLTLALCSLWVAMWLWWAHMAMPAAMNARALTLGFAIGEVAALFTSALIASLFFRAANARRRRASSTSPAEPR